MVRWLTASQRSLRADSTTVPSLIISILPNAEVGDPDYQKKYGMQLVETEVVNIHGELLDSNREVTEPRDLVVATHAMPKADRVRIRAYCWTAGLLHFDKVLQIPLIIVLSHRGVSYRELIELFSDGSFAGLNGATPGMFPVLTEIREFVLFQRPKTSRAAAGNTVTPMTGSTSGGRQTSTFSSNSALKISWSTSTRKWLLPLVCCLSPRHWPRTRASWLTLFT